jgi:transposase InsO family protein
VKSAKSKPTQTTIISQPTDYVARRNAIATLALAYPWWGYKRIAVLARREGWKISDRKTYKILKQLDLLIKLKKPKAELYQAAKLFELLPDGPNQLFQTDVTYLHIPGYGWWYAVTVIDYYSRYLLACHLTPSYRAIDCVEAFEKAMDEAERLTGVRPTNATVVTDNGSSFLARRFRQMLKSLELDHARIQYRTPTQLGLLERFHQTLKREEVHWRPYENPEHARRCLEEFRHRYNAIRPHWALIPDNGGDVVTPEDVYLNCVRCKLPKWQGWAQKAKEIIEEQTRIELATGTH